jgi:hypothetical protein
VYRRTFLIEVLHQNTKKNLIVDRQMFAYLGLQQHGTTPESVDLSINSATTLSNCDQLTLLLLYKCTNYMQQDGFRV